MPPPPTVTVTELTPVTSISFSEYPPAPPLSHYPDAPPPPPTTAAMTLLHPDGLVHVKLPAVVYEVIDNNAPSPSVELNLVGCMVPSENTTPFAPSVTGIV